LCGGGFKGLIIFGAVGKGNFVQHLLRLSVTIFLLKGSKKDFHFYPPALGHFINVDFNFNALAFRNLLPHKNILP